MWHRLLTSAVSLKNKYNNLKIRHKLFLINLTIVVIVCLINLITFQVTLFIYQGIIYNQVAKELNFFAANIEKELEQIERYSYEIITDSDIQSILEKLKNNSFNQIAIQNSAKLSDRLWSFTFERNIISVNIIDTMEKQYTGGVPIISSIIREISEKAAKRKGAIIFIEPVDDSSIICARQIRKIRDLSLEPLGTLIIKVNTPSLIQQCIAGSSNNAANLMIMSNNKTIYSSSTIFGEISKKLTYNNNTNYRIVSVNGRRYFSSYIKSNYTHWTYIGILPYQLIFSRVSVLKSIILLSFLFILVIASLLGMKLANNLTSPIERLSNEMQSVQNGNFNINKNNEIVLSRTDEIGSLEKDFIIMIDKINNLIYEDYTKQLLVKNAELTALRANINPHFLYNTLESINWLAKTNNQTKISLMVESLGRLLRNAISQKDHLATLAEEVSLLNDYITIQKIRFGNRLEFRLDIDHKWQEYCVPRLSLQPIVENSITYGLEKMLDICKISVTSREEHNCLLIIVEDNGPGISAEDLEKLKKWQYQSNGLGVGLKNIDDRLKLIFGDQYGIDISSDCGIGTTVILKLPIAEEEYA